MPAAGHARLRDRRKDSSAPVPTFGHSSRRRSHLSFVELSARAENETTVETAKNLPSGQLPCELEPTTSQSRDTSYLCDPCQALAATVLANCSKSRIASSATKSGDAWFETSGSDTLTLRDHHGDYEGLVKSALSCQLCHLLSMSWYSARGRQVRGHLGYQIQRGKLDHTFSLWTQKIDLCSNGCCTEIQTVYHKLRTFEPFLKRDGADIPNSHDSAFLTKNEKKSVYGREVPLKSNHTVCFQMITQWLKTCQLHHPDCNKDPTALLPKRLIDVRPPSGGDDCRLIEPENRDYAPYIALSHCWGGRSLFCTTRSNYDTYKDSLRIEDFPNTFRDAVELTRGLGFKYLWIDALCIIQGDSKDWEEQADAVGDYYRNAALTVSAMRAPDYNAGLFHLRKSVSAVLTSDMSSSNRKQLFIREAYSPSPSTTTKITGPVSERGWVLQERLLSPAVLHFTKREIIWECRTQTIFEHGSYAKPQDRETKLLLVTGKKKAHNRATTAWNMSRPDRFKEWYKLVQIYSAKKLTRSDDRLPAIAGLATRFHEMCESNYLAGIWADDALRGLLWNTGDQIPPTDGVFEASIWHTPSWSWASIRRPVNYNTSLGDCVAQISVAKIHRIDVDTKNPKSFGHVEGGCLEITGLLRPASLLKVRLHMVQMRWDRRPNCVNDRLWSFELGSWEVVGETASTTVIYFLLLEPLDLSGIDVIGYQRVGLAWCEWTGEKRPIVQPDGQSMRVCIV